MEPKEEDEEKVSRHVLTTMYDITRQLFKYFPIRTVDLCSNVCQSWCEMSRVVMNNRRKIQSYSYIVEVESTSSTENVEPIEVETLNKSLSKFFNEKLWFLPKVAVIVATNELDAIGLCSRSESPVNKCSRQSSLDRRLRRGRRVNLFQSLLNHFNKSCEVLMLVSEGIVTSNDENQSKEIESGLGLSFLLFPKLPSKIFGIFPFQLSRRARINDFSRSELHKALGNVPEDLPIRCVIFFFRLPQKEIKDCLKKLTDFYCSDIVFVGGFVDEIRRKFEENSSFNTCGLALTGDREHLEIRQVVLDHNVNDRELIREKLEKLKSNFYEQSTMSFGIQISCVARGAEFYNQQNNVESSEFRRLFPRTCLIGIFGNGELGHDFFSDENRPLINQAELFRGYSTIFCLISIRL